MYQGNHSDVHILNVGAGSSTVIESPSGRVSMIDTNDGGALRSYEKRSLAEIYFGLNKARQLEAGLVDSIEWVRERLGPDLWRFVLSHPDADHMSGIRRILRDGELQPSNFWDLPHVRHRGRNYVFRTEGERQDWLAYQAFRQAGGTSSMKLIRPLAEATGHYWTDDDIEILGPTAQLVDDADDKDVYNDASYVLRARHATSSVLIPGDVEGPGWDDMMDRGHNLRANVLIASHHGRKTGYSERAMASIRPEVVIASAANLPAKEDGLPLYRKHTPHVYSTREVGTVTIRMHSSGDIQVFKADGDLLVALHDAA
jgi:beta-lactamase superfamily II metal-dependent hydrolase